MGTSRDGIDVSGDYATPVGPRAKVQALLDGIPDPDTTSTSGSQSSFISYLDEMTPIAATVLRVELMALQDALDSGATHEVAYGSYTMVTADDTANLHDIVTGLGDLTLAKCAVSVFRAGANVTGDAVITEPVAGTLRVADGSTYHLTAGDIINWFAREA